MEDISCRLERALMWLPRVRYQLVYFCSNAKLYHVHAFSLDDAPLSSTTKTAFQSSHILMHVEPMIGHYEPYFPFSQRQRMSNWPQFPKQR